MTRRYLVRGRVQGVGFRWFVARTARRLGLTGHARNLPEGTVEVVATGDPAELDQLAQALTQGPPGAVVAGVEVENLVDAVEARSFDIM
jgi:acylphosphatase